MGKACGRLPLVDKRVLRRLREELGFDADYCDTFVGNYLQLLPLRIGRLRSALYSADFHGALDALLSLKTSSRMVGAVCLGSLAAELEHCLRSIPASDYHTEMPRFCENDQLADLIDHCSYETVEHFTVEPAAQGLYGTATDPYDSGSG